MLTLRGRTDASRPALLCKACVLGVALVTVNCSAEPPAGGPAVSRAASRTPGGSLPPGPSPYDSLPAAARAILDRPFTGDLPRMVERRLIRAGVVFNRTQYFIDRGQQRGMVYDSLVLFEEQLNKRLDTGPLKVHVAFVPLQRDQLFTALNDGLVDLVAAVLTVTPARQRLADFTQPTRTGVSEIVVGSRTAAPVATADDLSGRQVFIRRSSSYHESVLALNERLAAAGRPLVVIKEAPEALEDDDLLEMVNAGLVDLTIVDDFVARFWHAVFPDLQLFDAAAVRSGGTIAVAVRKTSPVLRQAINTWIGEYGPRTAFGNTVNRRYLQRTDYVRRAADDAERKKFEAIAHLIQAHSATYGLDHLAVAAQAYQESGLDQGARSQVGAIGVMQVMPATGKQMNVGDIRMLDANIHAGTKYIRFMMDQYFRDDPMDELNKILMTFASYNAGPARVRQLRREAAGRGLDPNVWFGNVERVASERIGRETVQYVSNIYKYYVAYRLARERADVRAQQTRSTRLR